MQFKEKRVKLRGRKGTLYINNAGNLKCEIVTRWGDKETYMDIIINKLHTISLTHNIVSNY